MQHGTSNSMSSFSTCDITSGPVGFSAAGRKDSETDAALSWALSSLPQGAVRRGRVAPCGAGGWLPSRTWKSSGTSLKSPPHPAGLSSQAGRSAHGSSNTDCRFNRQVTKPCSAAGNRRDNRSPRLWSKNGRVQRGTLAEVTTPGGPHEERAPGCSWPRQEADSPSLLVQSVNRSSGRPTRRPARLWSLRRRSQQSRPTQSVHHLPPFGAWFLGRNLLSWFLCLRELFVEKMERVAQVILRSPERDYTPMNPVTPLRWAFPSSCSRN